MSVLCVGHGWITNDCYAWKIASPIEWITDENNDGNPFGEF